MPNQPTPTPAEPTHPHQTATPDDPDPTNLYACRRPGCNRPNFSLQARKAHEADASKHRHPEAMTYLCDWQGHADAIEETGICAVCD